jgi:hypothetical protein
MKKDIALLTDNSFVILKDKNKLEKYEHDINIYTSIIDLVEECLKYNIFNVWVSPYTDISGKFVTSFLNCTDNYGVKGKKVTEDNEYVKFVRAFKRDGTNDILITVPEYEVLWKFTDYEDISPNDLAIMLVVLRDKLEMDLYNSPTKIGISLLEYLTTNSNFFWLRSSDTNLNNIPTATSLVWRYKGKVSPKKYLHVYDKNGAFLSSYQSALMGSGNAIHYDDMQFDENKVGVWKVTISGSSMYNGIDLPLPYNEYATNGYYWTPELKIAKMLGYDITVHECYIWNESHYIFRLWAKLLWDSREELKEKWLQTGIFGYKLAYDMIKSIYTETGGRLAHRDNNYSSKDVYQRIDWFSLVVSDTRLKVLNQIDKLLKLGYKPIMVETDAIYYLSDEKDYKKAIPTLTDREKNLGGYKHKYSIEWNKVSKQFNSGISANKFAELLNQLERERKTF